MGRGQARVAAVVALGFVADQTIPDRDGVTALEHATSSGHDEVARILRG